MDCTLCNVMNNDTLNLETLVGERGEGGRSRPEVAAEGAGESLAAVRLLRDAILI